jgi:hypothetical protein
MRTMLRAAWACGASTAAVPVAVVALLAQVYVRWAPTSPDFAAQLARAELVRRAGDVSWWTGWFGGISPPSYSVLVPSWMAVIGVRAMAAIAAVATAGAGAGAILARDANVVAWIAPAVTGSRHAGLHRRSKVTASTVSLSDTPCNRCRHTSRHARPAPPRSETDRRASHAGTIRLDAWARTRTRCPA